MWRERLLPGGAAILCVAGAIAVGLYGWPAAVAMGVLGLVCVLLLHRGWLAVLIPIAILLPYDMGLFLASGRISPPDLLVVLFVLLTLLHMATHHEQTPPLLVILPLFSLMMSFAGSILADSFAVAMGVELKRWSLYSFLPLCLFHVHKSSLFINTVYTCSLISLSLFVASISPIAYTGVGVQARAVSLLYSPNTLGWVTMLLSLWLLTHRADPRLTGWSRRLVYVAILAATVTLGLSASRGAAIGYAVGLCYLVIRANAAPTQEAGRRIGALVVITLLLVPLLASPGLRHRFTLLLPGPNEDPPPAISSRQYGWGSAAFLIGRQPLWGYGTGNLVEASSLVLASGAGSPSSIIVSTTDSQVLDILLEGGIVKLFFWAASLYLCWREASSWRTPHRLAFHASLVALLTAGLIAGPSFTSPFSSLLFWLFFATSYSEVRPNA